MDLTEMIGGINNKVTHIQCSELIREIALCINAACCYNLEATDWERGRRKGWRKKKKRGKKKSK